jgi:hypothetical protein
MVIIGYMVIRIDISILPSYLRRMLMREIGLCNRYRKSPNISDIELSDTDKSYTNASDIADEIPIDGGNSPHTTGRMVKDALIKNGIRD